MYFRDIKEATAYVKEHGVEYFTKSKKVGKVQYYCCPLCGSGMHTAKGSKSDGAVVQGTENSSIFTCFSCQFSGDVIAWIAKNHNVAETSREAFDLAYKEFNVEIDRNTQAQKMNSLEAFSGASTSVDKSQDNKEVEAKAPEAPKADYTRFYRLSQARLGECDYLKKRGISDEVARQYGLGYMDYYFTGLGHMELGLVIPLSKESYSVRNTNEATMDKQRYQKKGDACLFNSKALLNSSEPVFITEGELDALSVIEAGAQAVALGSTKNMELLVNTLKSSKPDKGIILCMDNDEAGATAVKNYFDLLKENKLSVLTYVINIAGEYKDANEALLKGKNAFIKVVTGARYNPLQVAYRQKHKSDADRLGTWWENIHNENYSRVIPTGFQSLDNALGGGLGTGFIGFGAIPALGKTTLGVQIANNIARNGNDVLFFTLELSGDELISKTISRLTAQNSVSIYGNTSKASSSREIMQAWRWAKMDSKKQDLIYYSRRQYEEYAEHIYTIEGEMDYTLEQIQKVVKEHITITGNKPIVFVDYLQILGLEAKEDRGLTDKAKADKLVKSLRKLALEFDIPIVVISSFNRENYNAPVSFSAFKESGGIEYGADFLIGLQYSFMARRKDDKGKPEDTKPYLQRIWKENDKVDAKRIKGEPLEVEAVVLKSRYSGGGRARFNFLGKYNFFAEVGRAPEVFKVDEELLNESKGKGNVTAQDMFEAFLAQHNFEKVIADKTYFNNRAQFKFEDGSCIVLQADEGKDGVWSFRNVNTCQVLGSLNSKLVGILGDDRPLDFDDEISKD